MHDPVQLKANVPQALKRQAFSIFALRGIKFSPWVREQLEQLVEAHRATEREATVTAQGVGHV